MKFIGRKKELEILESEYKHDVASFIVVYGRRRIGKTRLIEEFLVKKPSQIYYLAADETDVLQIRELRQMFGVFFKDEFLANHEFNDWKDLFSYLEKIWPRNKKIIFGIDEVTYLIKNNNAFASYLQQFWDKFLSKTKTKLIVSGSLVNLMLKFVLQGGSPLYGRRTAEIKLEELQMADVQKFLNKSFIETIKFYALLGGVPKYLEFVKSSFDNFLNELFDKRSFFYREGIYLMTEEFNEVATYSNILKAISEGKTKLNEIADFSGIEGKKISAYLSILANLGFIREEMPVNVREKKFRGKNYLLNDSFLDFWFKIIYKNRSLIELDQKDTILKNNHNEINSFIGRKFENVCMQYIIISDVFNFTKIGRAWGKTLDNNIYEIDIVALNEKTKEILFCECKWKGNVDAKKILAELKEKSQHVQWHNSSRKEHFCIIAKSFKKKLDKRECMCFDLDDLEKAFNKK